MLSRLRKRMDADVDAASLLDQAQAELKTSLADLRELAAASTPQC